MSSPLKERLYKTITLPASVLTFVLLGSVILGVSFAIRRTSEPDSGLLHRPSRTSNHRPLQFRSTAIFDGTRDDGIRFSNEVYKSSDCSTIIKGIELFDAPTGARAELERQLQQAQNVLERDPQLGFNGQPTVKVKLSFAPDSKHKQYSILWTENSELHSISADSLQDAEAFNNWLTIDKQQSNSEMAEEITFQPHKKTSGTNDGVAFVEQQFRSSGCVTLSTRIEYFDTSDHAEELLERKIKSAVQLIEKGPKTDAAGQRRGERVVIVLGPDNLEDFQHKFVVMWTQDSQLHCIEAPILNYVLEFEKRYYVATAEQ